MLLIQPEALLSRLSALQLQHQSFIHLSEAIDMQNQSSLRILKPDGSTVHAFTGDDGLVYRACVGETCVFCADQTTAQAHLNYWGSLQVQETHEPQQTGSSEDLHQISLKKRRPLLP